METERQNYVDAPRRLSKPILAGGIAAGALIIALAWFAIFLVLKNMQLQVEVAALSGAGAEPESAYVLHELDYEMSLELPKDWVVLPEEENSRIMEEGGEFFAQLSAADALFPKVIFGAGTADPAAAAVSVLAYSDKIYVGALPLMLSMAEQSGGQESLKRFLQPKLESLMALAGKQVTEMDPAATASVDGRKVLVLSYKFKDNETGKLWSGRQYQAAFPNYVLEASFVWEEDQADILRPIVEKALASIKFSPLPAGE